MTQQVLSTRRSDEVHDQLLQGVVTSGTGTAAALPAARSPARPARRENYGDAWFVGYTPQLVTARVGRLPATSSCRCDRVPRAARSPAARIPALIWKAFMSKALAVSARRSRRTSRAAVPLRVAGHASSTATALLERDNGLCKNTYTIEFFGGAAPARTATCKRTRSTCPTSIGVSLATREGAARGQPLTPRSCYKPAKPGQRLGIVVRQYPDGRHALGVRQGHARAREVAARRRAERRRADARRRARRSSPSCTEGQREGRRKAARSSRQSPRPQHRGRARRA